MEILNRIAQTIQCFLIEAMTSIARIITEPFYMTINIIEGIDGIFNPEEEHYLNDDDEPSQKDVVVRGFRK